MHAPHSSTLLPDLFRHKSTKVRLLEPKAILLDFHGTISERRWEDKVVFPYVRRTVGKYLRTNWFHDAIQQCFAGLRNESFEQRFRNKYDDAPIISDTTSDGQEVDIDQLVAQVADFLVWQMTNKKETKDTQVVERLIWRDGFKQQQIKVPIYDDVVPCIQAWHTNNKCKIFVTSSIEEETIRLLFSSTDKGDLNKLIDGYLCSRKVGEKRMENLYQKFYENLNKPQDLGSKSGAKSAASPIPEAGKQAELKDQGSTSSDKINQSKPILFITDSGQEAKAASSVADGRAYDCLLIQRPGNKKIRTYYMSKFSYIEKFDDIQFV